GLGANPNILKTVKEADTILAFGTRLSEVTTQDYQLIRNDQTLVHVDIEPGTIGKVYPPEIGIVSDLHEALNDLTEIQLTGSWEEWTKSANQRYLAASNLEVTEEDVINKHIIAYLA